MCVDVFEEVIVFGGENGDLCLWNLEGKFFNKYREEGIDCISVFFSFVKKDVVYVVFNDVFKVFNRGDMSISTDIFIYNFDEIN